MKKTFRLFLLFLISSVLPCFGQTAAEEVVYQGETFSKDVLQKHLSAGEIRFQKKVWIHPSQICGNCKGAETLFCPDCKGAGKVTAVCAACSGNGTVKCGKCGGTGRQPCPDCETAGSLEKACSLCGGVGIIYRNRVVRAATDRDHLPTVSTTRVTCTRCKGNRTLKYACQKCKKAGYLPCQPRQTCSICNGIGKEEKSCGPCGGSGRISCSRCGAKGYIGAPVKD